MECRSVTLRATLHGTETPVWRQLLVPGNTDLASLHLMLQAAFDWSGHHHHNFHVDGDLVTDMTPYCHDADACRFIREETALTVEQLSATSPRFTYEYDFVERRQVTVALEARTTCRPDWSGRAVCLDGAGTAPAERCDDRTERVAFSRATVNARLASVEVFPEPIGYGFVGPCLGGGLFTVVGAFERPGGTFDVAVLSLCVAGGLGQGGYVRREQTWAQLELMLGFEEEFGSHGRLADVPLSVAARLVDDCMFDDEGLMYPAESHAADALQMFLRLPPADDEAFDEIAPTERRPTLDDVRRLLQRPEFVGWTISPQAFDDVGCHPPGARPPASWFREVLQCLDAPGRRYLYASMARHQAQWCFWLGDEARAAVLARLAVTVEEDFPSSPLARVACEHGVRLYTVLHEDGS